VKDVIIIGAGPAGLSAAIYGIRSGLDLVVLERLSPGGQVMNTYEVENYPGFVEPIAGWELMSQMEGQTRRLGAEIVGADVLSLTRDADGMFTVEVSDGPAMRAKAVIAAAGASYRRLKVPGEEELIGHGVSFCATCDGAFYKNRVCAVIGGGDTALEEAHFLTRFASTVYLVHRRDQFRGVKVLQDRVAASGTIVPVLNTVVESINGSTSVESISLKDVRTGETSSLKVDGVFVFVGFDANTKFLPKNVLTEAGEVIADIRMRTPVQGLFAAGDLRSGSRRQIVMAAADGAVAALESYDYILSLT
jgi:thioredoxin reductase (NADPH)